jgi:hypothetical protein
MYSDAVVTPDLVLREYAANGCYAFGYRDDLTVKTLQRVTSSLNNLEYPTIGDKLRQEARAIVRERLQRDGLLPTNEGMTTTGSQPPLSSAAHRFMRFLGIGE